MKQISLSFFLLLFSSACIAQKWEKTSSGIKTVINNVNIEIRLYSASTARIIKSPAGTTFDKKSLSVIKTEQPVAFSAKEQKNLLVVKTDSLLVKLDLPSGAVAFYSKSDLPLLTEKKEAVSFTPIDDAGSKS
jgi:alpha-D-xyloside xylohydrolase